MSTSQRPNILLLHTDQQRFDTIAELGARHMTTPNMDRLARSGMVFTRAYSSNPICQPARHDLLTAVSARHHGYYGNTGRPIADYRLPTLPRALTASGYQTIAVGKMHYHPEREHHGFEHMFLMEELPSCRANDAYLQYLEEKGYGDIRCQHGVRPIFYHSPQPARVPDEHTGSAWIATKTIEELSTPRDRPVFLFASWVGPHPPFYVPQEYLDMYRGRELPGPRAPEIRDRWHTPPSPEQIDGEQYQRVKEAYCAAITQIDHHIGRILDFLESSGMIDNTLVLFTSDHGEMLGDRGGYQKHVPHEGSAHIPMIACGAGIEAGRCGTPVTTWDTAATILEAAGVDAPEGQPLIGRSLREIARSGEDRTIVFHHGKARGRYVAAVTGDHKFVHWFNGGDEELYNLAKDPWEQVNLAEEADSSVQEIRTKLRRACIEFEATHGVDENVEDGEFKDRPYEDPSPHERSLYPTWSSFQFPRWMDGYSKRDLELIEKEMRDCLRVEGFFMSRDSEWWKDATEKWKSIGGDPALYEEFRRIATEG